MPKSHGRGYAAGRQDASHAPARGGRNCPVGSVEAGHFVRRSSLRSTHGASRCFFPMPARARRRSCCRCA